MNSSIILFLCILIFVGVHELLRRTAIRHIKESDNADESCYYRKTSSVIVQAPNVFISYSRKDQEQAYAICELLNKNDISYWIDKEGKYSGNNFKGVIVEQIKNSAIVLFLSSQNSNQSPNVVKEIGLAVHYSKPIILIKLDTHSYDVNIEYDLCNIDYIEYTSEKIFENRLIDNIRGHM